MQPRAKVLALVHGGTDAQMQSIFGPQILGPGCASL